MKNIFKTQIVGVLALAMTLPSCSDFLDKLPENKVEEESVDYTKTSEMYMPVSGVYATVNKNLSAWMVYGITAVRGDDVAKGSSATDQIEYNYCKEFQYEKIKSFWALNSAWSNNYSNISISNAAIESLAKYAEFLKTDDDRKLNAQYMAEVRLLRAISYFEIVKFWGDAPLLLDNQALNISKSPKEEVYKYIFDELAFCIDNLPAVRPNEQNSKKGAATKYTALFVKAKASMYNNDWDAVLAATDEIINSGKFSLFADFYQLFKIPGKLSNESLYELQFTDFGSSSGDIVSPDAWFSFQGPRGGNKPIEGWGFMVPTDNLIDFFKKRGETVRAETTILQTGITTQSGDVIPAALTGNPTSYSGKAYTPSNQMTEGRNGYGDNNNIRLYRYADVLLMNAEAKIRKNQNGDAPLNLVRERAKMAPITNATLEQVLDERRAELAMEWGERFYDLVRTDKAAATLPGFVKGQSEYYPVPQNQIDLNPNLK